MKRKWVVFFTTNSVFSLFVLFLTMAILGCSDNEKKESIEPPSEISDPIKNPILKVEVENYPDAQVIINNEDQTIFLNFETPARISKLSLNISLQEGVEIIEKPHYFNLTEEYILRLNNNRNTQEYKLSVEFKKGNFDGWTACSSFGELPEHIELYKTTSMYGREGLAYIAIVDMSKPYSLDVLGEKAGVKTPTEFYNSLSGDSKPTILINAGYFTYSSSSGMYGVSLLVKNRKTIRYNTISTQRLGETYYMTRSAVGFEKDKFIEINWVFTDGNYAPTFAYTSPSPNVEGEPALPKPSHKYPEGGKLWNLETAIGAGPIAAKNGKIIPFEKMQYELLTGDGTAQRPRAAIGLTSDNKMIFYVNQGNGFDDYYGYSWEEVGSELVKLGCYDVMHFDGGGSVCMLINGIPLIKGGEVHTSERPNPDGEIQRAVSTAVIVN